MWGGGRDEGGGSGVPLRTTGGRAFFFAKKDNRTYKQTENIHTNKNNENTPTNIHVFMPSRPFLQLLTPIPVYSYLSRHKPVAIARGVKTKKRYILRHDGRYDGW